MHKAVYALAQDERDQMSSLVSEYLPLVKKIGLHLSARLPRQVELDDLMQVGLMALVQASASYDAGQGASFATYASIRVKGAMLDEVRRNDWKPRSVQQSMKRVAGAISQLEARLGRTVQDAEIAAELGVSLAEYHEISRELVFSKVTLLEEAEEGGEPDPLTLLESAELKGALASAIKSLPEKEQLMMSLYYGEELNLKEIGLVMGVSESRVSQLHGQALARLRGMVTSFKGNAGDG